MRLVNCFDYALCKTGYIPEENREEAYKIYAEESFCDFLYYLWKLEVIDSCCEEIFKWTCFDFDLDEENYYELNLDRTILLLNKLFDNDLQEYANRYAEQEE